MKTAKSLTAADTGIAVGEALFAYPLEVDSTIAGLSEIQGRSTVEVSLEDQQSVRTLDDFLGRLLWAQLRKAGFVGAGVSIAKIKAQIGLRDSYDRWLEESLRILVTRGILIEGDGYYSEVGHTAETVEEVWREWERCKGALLSNSNLAAQVVLVEKTLRSLPDILSNATVRATDVVFPNGSMELVEGIYKGSSIANYFNDLVAEVAMEFIKERLKQDPCARIRILEIGAGTGGTSARVLSKLEGYQDHIEEYCYTDLSRAFLAHGESTYGREKPYLSYRIFDVERPIAEQGIGAGIYDVAIAANVLHATKNIHQTLRNAKAPLRTNGILLINEISRASLFAHLTFGLLEGWWLYEDGTLRIPGGPGLYPDTWHKVLREEGFHAVFFPAEKAHEFGQQVIVGESDGIVRQLRRRQIKKKSATIRTSPMTPSPQVYQNVSVDLLERVQGSLIQEVSRLLKVKAEDIDLDSELSEYGFDSISFTQLGNQLNQSYGLELTPTIFFEQPTLSGFARYLVKAHFGEVSSVLGASEAGQVDVTTTTARQLRRRNRQGSRGSSASASPAWLTLIPRPRPFLEPQKLGGVAAMTFNLEAQSDTDE
jgi:acyl carrier protein